MKFDILTLGDYSVNCYLVWDEQSMRCAIVDPGYRPDVISAKLDALGLSPAMILLTHAHFDHVGAVGVLREKYRIPVYVHEAELELPAHLTDGPIPCTSFYRDGDSVSLDGLTFRVLHTPGHTPGSVCLICDGSIFSGDTLFAGVCGRTDMEGGNMFQMIGSLRKLRALDGDFAVYPGHGPATTLSYERKNNLYMR